MQGFDCRLSGPFPAGVEDCRGSGFSERARSVAEGVPFITTWLIAAWVPLGAEDATNFAARRREKERAGSRTKRVVRMLRVFQLRTSTSEPNLPF